MSAGAASGIPPLPIRTRLALAVVAVLFVTLGLSGLILIRGTRATLVDQVDDQVRAYARRVDDRRPPQEQSADADQTLEIELYGRPVARLEFTSTGEVRRAEASGFTDNPDPLPDFQSVSAIQIQARVGRIFTVRSEDTSLRYRALIQRQSDGEFTLTAVSLASVDAALARLVRMLLVVGVVALAAAAAASWWLIRRDLRPVDQMVDTAAMIAAGDLSKRVVDADPRTELGRLGRALNEMLQRIETAARARAASESRLRQFVADAAHELRTPLTSLRGYAELYRTGGLPDETGVTMAMDRIESEGARMARLVEEMLLLARLDQQRGLDTRHEDIGALVANTVADFRAVDPERAVTTDIEDDIIVSGDPFRLRQVIDNLLTNVRIHTPSWTPVHVAVGKSDEMAVVSVEDTGPGIAQADQERIFDRFWRGGPARLRSGTGTGLGLSIVASLVEAHGGTIEVHSDPGKGTRFIVRIPLAQGAA